MIGYEIYIRSFYDYNSDGIGDFKGLSQKVSYLKDLGVDLVWIMPHFRAPSYHGYDIINFFDTNISYGTLEEFKKMVDVLHENGIRVVIDLPLNHVSSRHPWFKAALEDDPKYKNYFLWADEDVDLSEKRPWDNEVIWHPYKGKWYYGVFGGASPDLNYENEEVVEEALKIVEFWLKVGVDGFRFDAAKHIYDYDTVNKRFHYNHEKNIAFWKKIMDKARGIKSDVFAVTEVWDSPEIVMEYAKTIGCSFNFYFTEALKESMTNGNTHKIWDCFSRTLMDNRGLYIPSNFSGNHDITRLASVVKSEEQRKVFFAMLLTTPGIPFIYYGDELGMKGVFDPYFTENVIEPMPWYASLSGEGQTLWKSIGFNYAFTGVSVEEQLKREDSLLNTVKQWIRFRKENTWMVNSWIVDLKTSEFVVAYTITNGEKSFRIYHNIAGHEEHFEGIHLKPFESKVL
ncbi:4-alpha-glucanotransferase [Thermosipho sp. 1063]|uniref:alpha-amylase family glycosyl hydrolase n=1 Tax=unclassified Thermosipho (in: thermotogales) TaxID=2676525 RepID=UPI0009493783|nr:MULTISPECIES: alpha-amylase family glycosyl hydrolase [unclassified Thermosipho (in: thermotogales)]ANQ53722.1 alpha-amylase [Thermosipho sp. 1070]APT72168.1 4-alpha-glucanotransferase [Thermosipho sp. 1063]OOC43409.1 alpha-amylase [Thermosipho sp. 1074]